VDPLADKRHVLPGSVLVDHVVDARARTLALVADLADHQLDVHKLDIVNPFRWELGHVGFFYEAFFVRLLCDRGPLLPGGDDLYDSFVVDHDDRWGLPLPSRAETLAYLERVRAAVLAHLLAGAPDARTTYLTLLCVQHEDMHGEAFTWMRQTLGYPAPRLLDAETDAAGAVDVGGGPHPGDAEIPGGSFTLGADVNEPFVFDNEKTAHVVDVTPFRIARAPVSNAEYAAFVDAGGYRRSELWSPAGWRWRRQVGAEAPIYWRRDVGTWQRRVFDRWVALAPHAPVIHVGWHEAEAFCRFARRRLPTELEWEVAACAESTRGPGGEQRLAPTRRRYPWCDDNRRRV
jgi:iron(II)-dependent oxidoreductase